MQWVDVSVSIHEWYSEMCVCCALSCNIDGKVMCVSSDFKRKKYAVKRKGEKVPF